MVILAIAAGVVLLIRRRRRPVPPRSSLPGPVVPQLPQQDSWDDEEAFRGQRIVSVRKRDGSVRTAMLLDGTGGGAEEETTEYLDAQRGAGGQEDFTLRLKSLRRKNPLFEDGGVGPDAGEKKWRDRRSGATMWRDSGDPAPRPLSERQSTVFEDPDEAAPEILVTDETEAGGAIITDDAGGGYLEPEPASSAAHSPPELVVMSTFIGADGPEDSSGDDWSMTEGALASASAS